MQKKTQLAGAGVEQYEEFFPYEELLPTLCLLFAGLTTKFAVDGRKLAPMNVGAMMSSSQSISSRTWKLMTSVHLSFQCDNYFLRNSGLHLSLLLSTKAQIPILMTLRSIARV